MSTETTDLAACLDGIAAWMAADEAEGFLEHCDQEDR